jgi:hypothetical protein
MRRTSDLQRASVLADAERDTREAELRRSTALLREAEAQLVAATGVPDGDRHGGGWGGAGPRPPHRRGGRNHAASRLDIAVARREAQVEPDGVPDGWPPAAA